MSDPFHLAVVAFAAQDFERARDECRRAAAAAPSSRLYAEGAAYLDRVVREGPRNVYVSADGFRAFIRGGGNVGLYSATSAALRAVYGASDRLRLLDLGVGDGLALLPAIDEHVASVTLVEPSADMLRATAEALTLRGVTHDAVCATAQDFIAAHPDGVSADLVQATFSLQSIPRDQRATILSWVSRTAPRLLIAEFDVRELAVPCTPDDVRHLVARYEAGLAEYTDDGDLVAQGFLMPVFFGYFDETSARTNYEAPIASWTLDLRDAGFERLKRVRLFDYWWAPAYLLDARSRGEDPQEVA